MSRRTPLRQNKIESFRSSLETFGQRPCGVGDPRTAGGLEVHARLDANAYTKGRKVTVAEFEEACIKRHSFQGDWNYEIHPKKSTLRIR